MKIKRVILCITIIIIVLLGIFFAIKYKNSSSEDVLTNKELEDMEYVDMKIQEVINSEGYENMSPDDKASKMEIVLKDLKKKRYIKYYSYDNYMFCFEYKCGALGGVMLKDFDSKLN